ncbi:hypothetical protein ACJQWK_03416 [Exserohilum turcicum]
MPVYPSVLVFLDGTPPTTCPASLHCAVANMQRASAPTLAESVGAHMVEAIEHQLRWNYFSAFARYYFPNAGGIGCRPSKRNRSCY